MAEIDVGLSIGQVAAKSGLSVHTLRFYEREGMFAEPVRRDASGRRVYTADDVEWLSICTSFRASGMPLTEIRRYAELVKAGSGNEAERLALLRRHRERVDEQLSALTRCREVISYKVGVYEERVALGTAESLWSPPFGADTEPEDCPCRGVIDPAPAHSGPRESSPQPW
ncbi:MAG TPA: MerR family transcriptional regulator [Actinocrinis sp.]|jgi:DNA-binding transcriptional MerR regulator